ncbi:hypothetical protein, partial [Enterobacter intestinihominis]
RIFFIKGPTKNIKIFFGGGRVFFFNIKFLFLGVFLFFWGLRFYLFNRAFFILINNYFKILPGGPKRFPVL